MSVQRPPSAHRTMSLLLSGQRGFSLVEELVAIGLVALGIVLLLAMIGTGTIGVTTQRDHTIASGLARSQLELIKDAPYEDDHTNYPALTAPAGFSVSVAAEDWDPDAGVDGDWTGTSDSGMQRITVTVSRAGEQVLELQDVKVDR